MDGLTLFLPLAITMTIIAGLCLGIYGFIMLSRGKELIKEAGSINPISCFDLDFQNTDNDNWQATLLMSKAGNAFLMGKAFLILAIILVLFLILIMVFPA